MSKIKAKPFKWTDELKEKMANYIAENIEQFKMSQKADFARKMKAKLVINCDDLQMKNGVAALIKKYSDIRTKLNTSGFGVDGVLENTIEKGWILKRCPYYETLDAVMGTRPNITPPFFFDSGNVATTLTVSSSTHENTTNSCNDHDMENADILSEEEYPNYEQDPQTTDERQEEENGDPLADSEKHEGDLCDEKTEEPSKVSEKTKTATTDACIRSHFSKIGVPSKKSTPIGPRNALSSFSEILGDKMSKTADVEITKHKLEVEKFAFSQRQSENLLEVEKSKIQMEKEVAVLKIEAEKELKLMDMQNQKEQRGYELEKLELLIQLENAKKE